MYERAQLCAFTIMDYPFTQSWTCACSWYEGAKGLEGPYASDESAPEQELRERREREDREKKLCKFQNIGDLSHRIPEGERAKIPETKNAKDLNATGHVFEVKQGSSRMSRLTSHCVVNNDSALKFSYFSNQMSSFTDLTRHPLFQIRRLRWCVDYLVHIPYFV